MFDMQAPDTPQMIASKESHRSDIRYQQQIAGLSKEFERIALGRAR
jgi:hypothetical protein